MTIRAGTRTAVRHAPPPAGHRTFGIVDELNCYFDSPAEPNNVHVEIWLPGHLDPDRLRDAVTAMLAGQPRAGARRADRGWWHRAYAWEFPPQAAVGPGVDRMLADRGGPGRGPGALPGHRSPAGPLAAFPAAASPRAPGGTA